MGQFAGAGVRPQGGLTLPSQDQPSGGGMIPDPQQPSAETTNPFLAYLLTSMAGPQAQGNRSSVRPIQSQQPLQKFQGGAPDTGDKATGIEGGGQGGQGLGQGFQGYQGNIGTMVPGAGSTLGGLPSLTDILASFGSQSTMQTTPGVMQPVKPMNY